MKPEKIIKMLKSSNKTKAQEGLENLLMIAKSNPATFQSLIPHLKAGLGDSKKDIRVRFIVTVGIVGKDFPELIKPLILPLALNLQDSNDEIKYKAAYSLYIIALKDANSVRDAIPVMVKVIDYVVSQGAYPVFRSYKPYTLVLKILRIVAEHRPGYFKKSISTIAKCIDYPIYRPENPHSGILEFYPEAITILGDVGRRFPSETKGYVPLILRCYVDSFRYSGGAERKGSYEKIRYACIDALTNMSESMMSTIVREVIEYISNLNNYGRKHVEGILEIISKKNPKSYIKAIVKCFEDNRKEVRDRAVMAIETLGRKMPDLVLRETHRYIVKGDENTKINSMVALTMISKYIKDITPEIVEDVIRNISDKSHNVRLTAISTLGTFVEHHPKLMKKAFRYLIKALNDEYHQVRWTAIYAIARLGEKYGLKKIAPLIPPLLERVNDPYDQVRWRAIDTLKKLNVDRFQFPHVYNEIKGTEKLIRDMATEDYDTNLLKKANNDLKAAYDALYKGNYQNALQINSKIKEDLIRIRTTGLDTERLNAGNILKDARIAIETAKNEGFETTMAEEYLNKARDAMKARKYDLVREYYNKIQETLTKVIKEKKTLPQPPTIGLKVPEKTEFNDIINWIEEQIIAAKQQGVDCTLAEKKLAQAKNAVSLGSSTAVIMGYITDAKIALKDAKSVAVGEGEMEAAAHEALASALAIISTAKAQNIDVSVAESLLAEAKMGLKQKDYAKVIKFASKAEDNAKKYLKIATLSRASEDLVKIGEWVEDAKEFGLDVTEAQKLLEMARRAFKEEDFEGVERYIRMIKDSLDMQKKAFVKRQAEELYNSIINDVEVAKTEGIDLTDIEEMITTAKEYMASEDYDKLYELTLKIEEMLSSRRMERLKSEAQKYIEQAKEDVRHLDKLGLVTDEIKKNLQMAVEMLEKENYTQAKNYAKELSIEIEAIIETGYKSALRRKILNAKTNVEKLDAEKLDVISIMKEIERAMELFDNKKYIECEKIIDEIDNRIIELKHQREMEEATNAYLRKKAEEMIKKAENIGSKDEKFMTYLNKARKFFDDGDYDDAILTAKKAIKSLQGK